ncbi:MAG: MFS transporter [Candidatus Bathyarchaeota archaeon]|nr:MAG: MFS transporter [Candidatus Bathyarchaeota archaeon]
MGIVDLLKREFSFITGNYRILVISWVIMDVAMEMPNPNFQKYVVETLHGPDMALGLIGLANFLAMAAVAFPGGYLADKYGRRWLITTMTFGMALSWLFFALAPTWHFILLGSIISSLCLIYQPALFALVQDSLPPERRGMGSSIIQLIHGTFNTPGPVIAGFLLLQFGLGWSMRIIYLLMTSLFLIAALWRLRLKETMPNIKPIRVRYFLSSYPKAIKESITVWRKVPQSMLWLVIGQTVVTFGLSLTMVINQIYAIDILGITLEQWWVVFVPLLLTTVVASLPIGKSVDKFGRKKPLILGVCFFGAAQLIFAFGSFLTIVVSMILLGIAQLLVMSSAMALATDLIDPVNRGKIVGFRNFIRYIVMGIGMLLGNYLFIAGKIMNVPQLPFYVAVGLLIPDILILIFLVHEPRHKMGQFENSSNP